MIIPFLTKKVDVHAEEDVYESEDIQLNMYCAWRSYY